MKMSQEEKRMQEKRITDGLRWPEERTDALITGTLVHNRYIGMQFTDPGEKIGIFNLCPGHFFTFCVVCVVFDDL